MKYQDAFCIEPKKIIVTIREYFKMLLVRDGQDNQTFEDDGRDFDHICGFD